MTISLLPLLMLLQSEPYAMSGEQPVAPYAVNEANAGARTFKGDDMAKAFHGKDGIKRIADRLVDISHDDPVIGEIFVSQDMIRLKRTIFEQFCYILNAGCSYSGRDMKAAHKDLGIQNADMNRLVEILQRVMREEKIPFAAQNRFLARLAPMRHDVAER